MKARVSIDPMTFEPRMEITNGRRTVFILWERIESDRATGKRRPWLDDIFRRRNECLDKARSHHEYITMNTYYWY
jgi:hypothetical protein